MPLLQVISFHITAAASALRMNVKESIEVTTMAKIIGVIPPADLFNMEKSTMSDVYNIRNNYIKRVAEAGALPMGAAPVDGWLSAEALSVFDGYIVQGGGEFWPYHYQVIHDAVENHKRYLGICLGEQLIHSYFVLRKVVEERGYEGDLVQAIWRFRSDPDCIKTLEPVEGHRYGAMTRGGEDVAKHDVTVVPGTILHRLVGRDVVRAASYHNLHVPADRTPLTINAWVADGSGVVEGVEYAPNILGVQFHPEVDDLLPEIFRFLTEEA